MTSQCTDCDPPIESGFYAIINKVNGNINLDHNLLADEYPVVSNPVERIWYIEHLEGHDYYILATPALPNFQGGTAVDKADALYAIPNAQPEVWVICGDHERTAPDSPVYIIKKKSEPFTKAWELERPDPGTQARVIPPPFSPGTGCEVNRVPEVFTWFLKKRQQPALF